MARTDNELIQRIQAGYHEDFRVLVERYASEALTLAVRIIGDRSEAEEAVQDAFVRVHRGLDGFRGDARFTTWFYRIVYNVCLTKRDRSTRHRMVPFELLEAPVRDTVLPSPKRQAS